MNQGNMNAGQDSDGGAPGAGPGSGGRSVVARDYVRADTCGKS